MLPRESDDMASTARRRLAVLPMTDTVRPYMQTAVSLKFSTLRLALPPLPMSRALVRASWAPVRAPNCRRSSMCRVFSPRASLMADSGENPRPTAVTISAAFRGLDSAALPLALMHTSPSASTRRRTLQADSTADFAPPPLPISAPMRSAGILILFS